MDHAPRFLAFLRDSGFTVEGKDGVLLISPRGQITEGLVVEIREFKSELLKLLADEALAAEQAERQANTVTWMIGCLERRGFTVAASPDWSRVLVTSPPGEKLTEEDTAALRSRKSEILTWLWFAEPIPACPFPPDEVLLCPTSPTLDTPAGSSTQEANGSKSAAMPTGASAGPG